MTEDEPIKCPACGEIDTGDHKSLIEKVCPPMWFSGGSAMYHCNVCSATFPVHRKKPSALI